MAESTASDPEPAKKMRASGIGVSDAIRSARASAGAFVNGSKQEYASIVPICRATASAISRAAVADLAVPEARHGVDQLVAVGVPQQRPFATGDRDEALSRRLGERMEEGTGHVRILAGAPLRTAMAPTRR